MRTRLSVCARKQRFADAEQAKAAALTATVELRYYRCDRCFSFHLTSRTKGKRVLCQPKGAIRHWLMQM